MSFKIAMARVHQSHRSFVIAAVAAAVLLALVRPAAWAAPAKPAAVEDEVQRILILLAAVGEEYREGVRDGTVVRPIEYEEAKTFFEDAERRLQATAPHLFQAPTDLSPGFSEVAAAIENKAPLGTVADTLTMLRGQVAALTGVSEQIYPPEAPSSARGKALFHEYCVACHGERGDGRGPSAAALTPPPADFTNAQFMHGETPYDFFHVVSLGKSKTAMPAWESVLSGQDRWDLVSYSWTLPVSDADIAEGQGIYLVHCASCHGATGNARGAFSESLVKAAPDLSQPQVLAPRTDAELFAAITAGVSGTPMPAFGLTLRDDERWKAVAFLRLLSLGGPPVPAASGPRGSSDESHAVEIPGAPAQAVVQLNATDGALTESGRLLDAAVAAYARGDRQAAGMASDAYMQFEPLETRLGATDMYLKTRIEERFLRLRQLVRTAGNETEARALALAIHDDFGAVRTALQPHTSAYALFVESATIILREGFEIVLVIGALLAYVAKTHNRAMLRSVYAGTGLGVAASLGTAFLMGELLQLHAGASDILEGITMLLAAVVLFWVSYWLISKSEAAKWQRYIHGKVQTALSGKRSFALASAAFLAVYREGFETVLFYQALYASAPTASVTVTAGFGAGAIALLIVYALLRRFQVQIPIRQFFFVTGVFLYVMAAIFAGQGIHELQDAGLIAVSPVDWMPSLPLLGVYPSVQSLLAQAVFVALLVYATAVTLGRRCGRTAEREEGETVEELRALRMVLESLRGDIELLRRSESPGQAALGERLEGLVVQAEKLAEQVRRPAPINGRANGGSHR